MKACGNTDVGRARINNEDDYCLTSNSHGDWIGIVCDGIGGSMAGEVASQIATKTMYESFLSAPVFEKDYEVSEWVEHVIQSANKKIYARSHLSKKMKGMGTTIVGIIITKNGSYTFNVGDSRMYAEYCDGFVQMSIDHSYVAQLVSQGTITEEEAKTHPKRNILTNALGVWATVQAITFNKIDSDFRYVLLCSDGLHGYVDENKIEEIVCDPYLPLLEKVNQLIQSANDAGGYDNCTVVLFDNTEVDHD